MIGAIYFLLVAITSVLFIGTTSRDSVLNIWRLFLVQLSCIGMLVVSDARTAWYVIWGAVFLIVAGIHCQCVKDTNLFAKVLTCVYVLITFICAALFFQSDVTAEWGVAVIVLGGLFFTYTPPGESAVRLYRQEGMRSD